MHKYLYMYQLLCLIPQATYFNVSILGNQHGISKSCNLSHKKLLEELVYVVGMSRFCSFTNGKLQINFQIIYQ